MEKTKKQYNPQIQIGYRVGHLTVESPTKERKNGYIVWLCRCDCGGTILLDTRYLKRGTVKDCGCITLVKPGQKDLCGKRFGKLICLVPTNKRGKSGGTVWRCQCDCGKECLAVSTQLIKGYKKDCGCMSLPSLKDYVNKRFGKLTVLEYAGKKNGMHYWKCLCDCGQETVVGQTLLQTGRTKSCGCLQKTMYEKNFGLIDGTSVARLETFQKRTIATNTSGYTGVYQKKKNKKWIAQISFKRKTYYLGTFERIEDAVKARRKGEEMHHDFLDWYYNVYLNMRDEMNDCCK